EVHRAAAHHEFERRDAESEELVPFDAHEGKAVPGAPAVGRRGGCASTPGRTRWLLHALCQWKKRQGVDVTRRQWHAGSFFQAVECAREKFSRSLVCILRRLSAAIHARPTTESISAPSAAGR